VSDLVSSVDLYSRIGPKLRFIGHDFAGLTVFDGFCPSRIMLFVAQATKIIGYKLNLPSSFIVVGMYSNRILETPGAALPHIVM
jgi:hypothetical protein